MWVEIGNQLRQAREAAGWSIEELQDKTQIDSVSLKALESGDFNRISSPFYVRSYIRTYAKKVGLEPTYLLKHYRPHKEGEDEGDSSGSGLQHTGTFKPTQQTSSFQALRGPEPGESPSAGSGRFQTMPSPQPSPDGNYDPFHNMREEPEETESVEPAATLALEGEETPSRSRSSKTKKWSVSELTQSLKMPAFNKKSEEKREENFPEGEATGSMERPELGSGLHPQVGDTFPPRSGEGEVFSQTGTDHRDSVESGWQQAGQEGLDEQGTGRFNPSLPPRNGEGLTDGFVSESQTLPPRGQAQSEEYPTSWYDGQTGPNTVYGKEEGIASSRRGDPSSSNLPALLPTASESGVMSRSGSRRQRARKVINAGKGFAFPKTPLGRIAIAVALVIILIPMTVWAASSFMEEPAKSNKKNTSSNSEDGATATSMDDQSGGTARLLSVSQGATVSEYKLSELDAVAFDFKASDKSWVQIRESRNPDGGYLKDVTLKPGEEFSFKHSKSVTKDLWVTIGSPSNVEVMINGQAVKSTKTIHIIKSDQGSQ
ncbi:helix-turn-helix domain-containing protein [Salinithrix halophila]|uniref:Helix-turn-helix domain-containing protein n=1 Tax=Salinithrix halophila TaxID=1485204 RepID=A0ABV8JJS1_9BACL